MNSMQTHYLMQQFKMLSLAMKECLAPNDQTLRIAVTIEDLDEIKRYLTKEQWYWDIDDVQENSVEFRFAFADVRILMYNRERY